MVFHFDYGISHDLQVAWNNILNMEIIFFFAVMNNRRHIHIVLLRLTVIEITIKKIHIWRKDVQLKIFYVDWFNKNM
jgi:hypothetical protein